MFKKLCVLAATTVVLSNPALAGIYDLSTVDVNTLGNDAFLPYDGDETWDDSFTFKIGSGSSVFVQFQLEGDYRDPTFTLSGPSFADVSWLASDTFDYASTGFSTMAIGGLIIGTEYTLNVNGGNVLDNSGNYYLALSVPAVPEPETYAMLLAGLGLVGMAARRRRQRLDS